MNINTATCSGLETGCDIGSQPIFPLSVFSHRPLVRQSRLRKILLSLARGFARPVNTYNEAMTSRDLGNGNQFCIR